MTKARLALKQVIPRPFREWDCPVCKQRHCTSLFGKKIVNIATKLPNIVNIVNIVTALHRSHGVKYIHLHSFQHTSSILVFIWFSTLIQKLHKQYAVDGEQSLLATVLCQQTTSLVKAVKHHPPTQHSAPVSYITCCQGLTMTIFLGSK